MTKYNIEGLNALAAAIHARSKRAGFWDKDSARDFDGQMMNVVTEAAEAQEDWRNGRGMTETHWTVKDNEGQEYELHDSLRLIDGVLYVRNYDYDFASTDDIRNQNVQEWLRMTPELLRSMPNMVRHLKPEGIPYELADIIIRVLDTCSRYGIDIEAAIADKMAYNETRPYRHGGKRS